MQGADDPAAPPLRPWILRALGCAAVLAIPLFVVDVPPVTDLPQHLAQVRLFGEALARPGEPYVIQWLTPYAAAYLVFGICWLVLPPVAAGKAALALLGLVWCLAVHALARARKRSYEAAALASMLFLGPMFSWGFVTFLFGFPVFIAWWLAVEALPREDLSWRRAAVLFGLSWALYFSHALWLAAGLVWLTISSLRARAPLKQLLLRAAPVLPVVAVSLVWFSWMRTVFSNVTVWTPLPPARLAFVYFADSLFGIVRGAAPQLVFAALLLWIGAALWQARAALRERIDAALLFTAALFIVCVLVLPYRLTNTIQFAARWAAPGFAFLLLALPAPAWRGRALAPAPWLLSLAWSASVALTWLTVQATELSGLRAALDALPERPRLLGLSYRRQSEELQGAPFLQTFAWGQVLKGGELNFSFADFGPSLVVYPDLGARARWTAGLEWFPEKVKPEDLEFFDAVLVGGPEEAHHWARERLPALEEVTSEGEFRLYRVKR